MFSIGVQAVVMIVVVMIELRARVGQDLEVEIGTPAGREQVRLPIYATDTSTPTCAESLHRG